MDKRIKNVMCGNKDCFGCTNGMCSVLRAHTKRRPCPFYKGLKEIQMEELRLYGLVLHGKMAG